MTHHLCADCFYTFLSAYTNIVRLTRPINLVIVFITMVVMRYAVLQNLVSQTDIGMKLQLSGFDFFCLILSAVMLTAAGNIINDYFDQKVDRINRPDKVIVGKLVKRRVAIVLHQVLNALSILLAIWVSYRTSYWWPILIPVVISTLLWWYSPVFKKRIFIGNLVVAICTAAVPFWAVVYEIHELHRYYADMLVNSDVFFYRIWSWTLVITGSAFVLTLVREAIKDIEDMQGDGDEQYRTIPIVSGIAFTKQYAIGLMMLFLAVIGFVSYRVDLINQLIPLLAVVVAILLPSAVCIYSITRAQTKQDFHRAGIHLKWLMLGGLFTLAIVSYFS